VVEDTIVLVVDLEVVWVDECDTVPPEPGMMISVDWPADRVVVTPVVLARPV